MYLVHREFVFVQPFSEVAKVNELGKVSGSIARFQMAREPSRAVWA